mgnify:CR=1 FL=1
MKWPVLGLDGKKVDEINLPPQFNDSYDPGLVFRAVSELWNRLRQRYGSMVRAGMNVSAKLSRRRRDYKGAYGHSISRVPRKSIWRRGRQFGWVGALAPGTVGGRRAHPPKSEKVWEVKINKKERRKAIRSALGGLVEKKKLYVVVKDVEDPSKVKDVKTFITKVGLGEEMKRIKKRVRAGKGKMRGRRYKVSKGPLFVVSKQCNLLRAGKGLLGFDVAVVDGLNADMVARGYDDVRYCVWSKDAVEKVGKEGLFK